MYRNWIKLPRSEGQTSRQAHADLPENTFEREIGREGFFGPASHMHHKHPPTAWASFEGPNRPRAFDTARLGHFGSGPWNASLLLHNPNVRVRLWGLEKAMKNLARNADGDEPAATAGGSIRSAPWRRTEPTCRRSSVSAYWSRCCGPRASARR